MALKKAKIVVLLDVEYDDNKTVLNNEASTGGKANLIDMVHFVDTRLCDHTEPGARGFVYVFRAATVYTQQGFLDDVRDKHVAPVCRSCSAPNPEEFDNGGPVLHVCDDCIDQTCTACGAYPVELVTNRSVCENCATDADYDEVESEEKADNEETEHGQ